MRLLSCAAVIAVALSSVAIADDASPMKPSLIRGTVESFDGKTLAIRTAAGAMVSLPVTGSTHFAIVIKKTFAQLKPTDFIGVTAVPGQNGHLRAEEIHTIPIHMNEGQYPWDHHPSTVAAASAVPGSMTNGTVIRTKAAAGGMMAPSAPAGSMTGTVTSTAGVSQILVSYHGASMVDGKCQGMAGPGQPGCTGTAVVDVMPDTLIQGIVPSFHPDVKPGMAVNAGVLTDAAGHRFLNSATLENDGLKPEF